MTETDPQALRARWRFAIVGPLLACPPGSGQLAKELRRLASKTYTDPVDHTEQSFSSRTIEGWYLAAKKQPDDPVAALRRKPRRDRGQSHAMFDEFADALRSVRLSYPSWTAQIVYREAIALLNRQGTCGPFPSYSTARRWMKREGLRRRHGAKTMPVHTAHETRRYEAEKVGSLWHLDFHHGGRRILTPEGQWTTPILLCILDDRSRFVAHAQWYLFEDTQALVHGFEQAIMKCGVPWMLMSDNGSAMTSQEFTEGLAQLGILHQTTLPYAPHQNGKQERFFQTIEGQFVSLLEGEKDLSLRILNDLTQTWISTTYHTMPQVELGGTPRERFRNDDAVLRATPSVATMQRAFTRVVTRKPRRKTATVTVEGVRFEIPIAHRHRERLRLRYRQWDLSSIWMVNPERESETIILRPEDTTGNASGFRAPVDETASSSVSELTRPALLQNLIDESERSGQPSAYIPDGRETR